MREPSDLAYLAVREKLSRDLASEPGDVAVRLAHASMADGYAEQIRLIKLADAA